MSHIGSGVGQVVICDGNEMSRNTRPTIAGLNGLFPSPPKVIFAMPIATIAPITIIHQSRFAGTLNARSIPVTIAEPSHIVVFPFKRNFWISHSTAIHATIEMRVTLIAFSPKK